MKPMGRRKMRDNCTDVHPHPKRIMENWWETRCEPCRRLERQQTKLKLKEYHGARILPD